MTFIIAFMVAAVSNNLSAFEIEGPAKVRDGDTIIIGALAVNIAGIDAPEIDQPCFDQKGQRWTCGTEARRRLETLIGNKSIACRTDGLGGASALCTLAGQDIARSLVSSGWALALGQPLYIEEERTARAMRRGLWKGKFISPSDWRMRNADPALLGAARVTFGARRILARSSFGAGGPGGGCAVKGNIISDGSCIFHRPGGRWYAKIDIDPSNGDRWFCSASEARDAGCRETRR